MKGFMNRYILGVFLGVSFGLCTIADAANSGTGNQFQLCANAVKNTVVARTKCKKSETVLSLSSLKGADGASSYDAIPSGKTVYGIIGFDGDTSNASSDWFGYASFPGKVDRLLTNEDVIVANTSNVDNDCSSSACLNTEEITAASQCTGSVDSPSAPAGKVCIYVKNFRSANINPGSMGAYALAGAAATSTPGFIFGYGTSATGDVYIRAVWAYTAP